MATLGLYHSVRISSSDEPRPQGDHDGRDINSRAKVSFGHCRVHQHCGTQTGNYRGFGVYQDWHLALLPGFRDLCILLYTPPNDPLHLDNILKDSGCDSHSPTNNNRAGQLGHQNTQTGAVQSVDDPRPEVTTPFD
jgi:hypothetical protein